jgi:hypothetical protein
MSTGHCVICGRQQPCGQSHPLVSVPIHQGADDRIARALESIAESLAKMTKTSHSIAAHTFFPDHSDGSKCAHCGASRAWHNFPAEFLASQVPATPPAK